MSAVVSGTSIPPESRRPAPMVPRPPVARSRRRPAWIAAGLLAICLGALGGVLLFTQVADSRSVVMVAQSVSRGEVIEAADLAVVSVGSVPGVKTVPADRIDSLVGKYAQADLVAGSLLPVGVVGPQNLPSGQVELGVRLSPGRLPQGELPTGTRVQLVAIIGSGQAAKDGLAGKVFEAVVTSAPVSSSDHQTVLLDVRMDSASAVTVAQLAAADRLVLIRRPGH